MNAIDFTTNFSGATSLFSRTDLYSKKRAKLGANKKVAIDSLYDDFLETVKVPAVTIDPIEEYRKILSNHGMVVFSHDITKAGATGAKKLRVGEVVTTASVKFSDGISIKRPTPPPTIVERKEEVPVSVPTISEPTVREEMTRTRRHEETPVYQETQESYHEPVVTPVVDEVSNRRLDSYLANNLDHNTSVDDQRFDKLAKKLSEIDALNRKASDLQDQEETLLAQEKAMDAQINEALRKADDDYFSATQSLDEVAKRINETQERMRRKQELINRLSQQNKVM